MYGMSNVGIFDLLNLYFLKFHLSCISFFFNAITFTVWFKFPFALYNFLFALYNFLFVLY